MSLGYIDGSEGYQELQAAAAQGAAAGGAERGGGRGVSRHRPRRGAVPVGHLDAGPAAARPRARPLSAGRPGGAGAARTCRRRSTSKRSSRRTIRPPPRRCASSSGACGRARGGTPARRPASAFPLDWQVMPEFVLRVRGADGVTRVLRTKFTVDNESGPAPAAPGDLRPRPQSGRLGAGRSS